MAGTLHSIGNIAFAPFRALLNSILNALPIHGQCRFDYVNTTTCRLTRYNGRYIVINGNVEEIPAAGVDFSVSGLTPGTSYYAYVYMNGSTMSAEWSTTGHSKDTSTGVEIKTGDPTRTLVGWVQVAAGPAFTYTTASKLVLSWFNRKLKPVWSSYSVSRTFNSVGAYSEPNSEIRISYGCWGEDAVTTHHTSGSTQTAQTGSNIGIGIDTSTGVNDNMVDYFNSNTIVTPHGISGTSFPGEGAHWSTVVGQVSAACTVTINYGSLKASFLG